MSANKSKINVELLTLAEKIRLADLSDEVAKTLRRIEEVWSLLTVANTGHHHHRSAELHREAAELYDALAYFEQVRAAHEAKTIARGIN